MDAPYVRPFNAPKYHAQQLRTLAYAKAKDLRLVWVVATDVCVQKEQAESKEQSEQWKETSQTLRVPRHLIQK